ncbi:unnamed protein product [Leuciscus chuanchicus]
MNPVNTAENWMIAVDQTIVKDAVTNCGDALVMMFVSYYCLNISYPLELGATLEFMQRCLFRINPDRGTKVEKQQSKKQQSINPKTYGHRPGQRSSQQTQQEVLQRTGSCFRMMRTEIFLINS